MVAGRLLSGPISISEDIPAMLQEAGIDHAQQQDEVAWTCFRDGSTVDIFVEIKGDHSDILLAPSPYLLWFTSRTTDALLANIAELLIKHGARETP